MEKNILNAGLPVPRSVAELQAFAQRARMVAQDLGIKFKAYETARANTWERSQKVIDATNPSRKAATLKYHLEAQNDWVKSQIAETQEHRWKQLKDLNSIQESANLVRDLYCNTLAIATAHSLGEERRGRISADIANLGPAALANLAKKAELTKDKDLASAIIARNDAMPRASRPVSSQLLAEAVFGDEAHKARVAVQDIEQALSTMKLTNQVFEGKPASPLQKLQAAMSKNPIGRKSASVLPASPQAGTTAVGSDSGE